MDYGDIIKRAWHITWRYKALWVLGMFAGVSGCQPGGGGSGGSSNYSYSDGQAASTSSADFARFARGLDQYVPALIALGVFLLFVLLAWSIFSIAARGGLITGVDSAEKGEPLRLGELWSAGFSRFWSIVGLGLVLQLPLLALFTLLLVAVLAPIFGSIFAGGEPGPEVFAPVCGSLAIGLPILIVLSFLFGILYLIALRYIVLGRQGVFEAIRNSWAFFRLRFKHTVLIWLINAGLNLLASFVVAIPIVILALAVGIPAIAAGASQQVGTLAVLIAVFIVGALVLSLAYNAVWGTFTSALWTAFFRDVTGMSAVAMPTMPTMQTAGAPEPPVQPAPTPWVGTEQQASPPAPEQPAEPTAQPFREPPPAPPGPTDA